MKLTHRKAEEYIRKLADLMGLKDWDFTLSKEFSKEDASASILCTEGQKHATIWLNKDTFNMADDEQRHIFVHELVHAHINPALHPLDDVLSGDMLRLTYFGFEYTTDNIAKAWAKFLPLAREI